MMRLQNREIAETLLAEVDNMSNPKIYWIIRYKTEQSSAQNYVILLCFFLYLYVKIFTAINKENEQSIKALYPH